jgi:3-hydroxyacyl-[acyl-carrier-protein] dehydratase
MVPQQEPFRFVDRLLEVDGEHSIGQYRWRGSSDFYRGHFPGDPVTPGVLQVESMAQCGVVPMGIFFFYSEFGEAEAQKYQILFTDATVEFSGVVRPGELVTTTSRTLFNRRKKLRVESEMHLEDGTLVCSGQLAGIGVQT